MLSELRAAKSKGVLITVFEDEYRILNMHELVQYHPLYWEDNWTKKLQHLWPLLQIEPASKHNG